MKTVTSHLKLLAATALALTAFTGCESTDGGGSSNVSASFYYGVGYYDTWYDGPVYYPPGAVTPPPTNPGSPAPRPEHPIANPAPAPRPTPRPMPSIPSAPRASFRR